MPWIEQIPFDQATGLLKEELESAMNRAGRIWHIVHIMSLNPEVLRASMGMYGVLMHGESPLSRQQREMLATVVSSELACVY